MNVWTGLGIAAGVVGAGCQVVGSIVDDKKDSIKRDKQAKDIADLVINGINGSINEGEES